VVVVTVVMVLVVLVVSAVVVAVVRVVVVVVVVGCTARGGDHPAERGRALPVASRTRALTSGCLNTKFSRARAQKT